ncbi:hypothetical protein RDABS01_023840, partial [Bienertia sinuspersici]
MLNNSMYMREIMMREGVRKDHGKICIELSGIIHQFKSGGQAHPEIKLSKTAKLDGFMPATELVLMDVLEEEKEENLKSYSEKLALAFGVFKTCPRIEIQITKNLCTCYDCHSWFKIVSKILTRTHLLSLHVALSLCQFGSK